MSLDDFTGDTSDGGGSSSSSTGTSTSTGTNSSSSARWHTRVDFGKPYVILARDRQGNLYLHRDTMAVLDDSETWLRVEDDFDKDEDGEPRPIEERYDQEYEILFRMMSKRGWLRFCNLAQDQLGVDPREVLEDDPEDIQRIEERVHYPPGLGPDQSRTCQVCGSTSEDDDSSVVEMRLEKHRRLAVCSSHTVEELAEEGYLQ
jgi:hypothetical protein